MTQAGVNELVTTLRRNKRVRRELQAVLWGIAALSAFQGIQRLSPASAASPLALHPVPSVVQALPSADPYTYRFRVLRPDETQGRVKVSIVGWKKVPGDGTWTQQVSLSPRFGDNETEKTLSVTVKPGAIGDANNPDRAFIGDASNTFFISPDLAADVRFSEDDRNLSVHLTPHNPFAVAAIQHPQAGQAVSLPTLSIRRGDATTMEEDKLVNSLQPTHTAKLVTAADKQGNVVATLAIKLETLVPDTQK